MYVENHMHCTVYNRLKINVKEKRQMGIMETTYLMALLRSTKHLYRQPIYRLTKKKYFCVILCLVRNKNKIKK